MEVLCCALLQDQGVLSSTGSLLVRVRDPASRALRASEWWRGVISETASSSMRCDCDRLPPCARAGGDFCFSDSEWE